MLATRTVTGGDRESPVPLLSRNVLGRFCERGTRASKFPLPPLRSQKVSKIDFNVSFVVASILV